jgi:DNA anti-recombination protein RmuC
MGMANDYMTESQGDQIITLLKSVLKELQEVGGELRGVNHNLEKSDKQLHRIEMAVESHP